MTLSCPNCGGADVELTDDNGADYPQTRVEFYTCHHCGNEFRQVLAA